MPIRIGIDVGGTKIEGVALDGSEEIARTRVETPRENYAATLDAIVRLVATLEQQAAANPKSQTPSPESRILSPESRVPNPESRLPTVGIGIPGALSPSTGRVKNANSTWLIGQMLQQDLELRLGRPVRIANDANCFAMSEAADGSGAGAEVVFAVIVGTGTGAGIVVRGQLVTGPNAIAGEWGHNPLPWAEADEMPGTPCYCGRRGCIETFLSGPGMTTDHERRARERLSPPEIVERAAAGEREAEITLTRYEQRMARALASVINVLDPDVIVLGGGLSNIERLYVNVPRLWAEFVFAAASPESRLPNPESRRASSVPVTAMRAACAAPHGSGLPRRSRRRRHKPLVSRTHSARRPGVAVVRRSPQPARLMARAESHRQVGIENILPSRRRAEARDRIAARDRLTSSVVTPATQKRRRIEYQQRPVAPGA